MLMRDRLLVRGFLNIAVSLHMMAAGSALAQPEPTCGSLANGYGPFDYRKERSRALGVVETHHFNNDVQQLRKGQEGYLGGDLDYVLRASPNHHRALAVISEWGVRTKTSQPPTLPRTIDCYFERAIRFQPDDYLVRMFYANYLQRTNQRTEALQVLEVLELRDDLEPYTYENLGLLLLDLNEPERALVQAWKALAQGWTRPALRERMERAGQWRDPPSKKNADPAPAPATTITPR